MLYIKLMKKSRDLHNSQKRSHFSKIYADNFSVDLLGKTFILKPREEKMMNYIFLKFHQNKIQFYIKIICKTGQTK